MDLRAAIRNFVEHGRDLYQRLHSQEGDTVTGVDLHVLQAQLYEIDNEVQRRKQINQATSAERTKKSPGFPPFFSDKDDDGEHTPP